MTHNNKSSALSTSALLHLYERLLYIRAVSTTLRESALRLELKCPVHFSLGQEATAVGLGAHLRRGDMVVGSHRSHAIFLAKGGSLDAMVAEIYNKETGCAGGTGGSMHLNSPADNMFATAIVGGGIPVATGMALAAKMRKTKDVAVAFFGDGAAEEGSLYESMNFAALKKLPVVFFCENNLYAVEAPIRNTKANPRLADIAWPHGIWTRSIDGNNVLDVYDTARQAIARARLGEGPGFIEALTYRWVEHVGPHFDHEKGWRSRREVEQWMQRCPVAALGRSLRQRGILDDRIESALQRGIRRRIQSAWRRMDAARYPAYDDIVTRICAN
jgi:pyruvate dehydrogenase E1 component alpha subunit